MREWPIANGDAWFARRGEVGQGARQAGLGGSPAAARVRFQDTRRNVQQSRSIGAAVAQEEGDAGVYTVRHGRT